MQENRKVFLVIDKNLRSALERLSKFIMTSQKPQVFQRLVEVI